MKGLMTDDAKNPKSNPSVDGQNPNEEVVAEKGDKKDLQIQILTEKVIEFEGKYKRALADYQNLERQTQETNSRYTKLATQYFVEDLIEPFDHLKLAAAHVKDKGLDMVINQFTTVLESQGVKEINPLGQEFDATRMEAVDTSEGEVDKVLTVVSSGYELNGFIVKPAKVIVGKK